MYFLIAIASVSMMDKRSLERRPDFKEYMDSTPAIFINVFIHNFWTLHGDPAQAHELQNFIKNLAIAAGLLVLATKDKN